MGEDLFYHWHVLESLVRGENKRVTSITPAPRGSGSHYAWWPWLDSHKGGEQDRMLKYIQGTMVGKEELRPKIRVYVVYGVKLCLVISLHIFMLCLFDSTNTFRALRSRVI